MNHPSQGENVAANKDRVMCQPSALSANIRNNKLCHVKSVNSDTVENSRVQPSWLTYLLHLHLSFKRHTPQNQLAHKYRDDYGTEAKHAVLLFLNATYFCLQCFLFYFFSFKEQDLKSNSQLGDRPIPSISFTASKLHANPNLQIACPN